jgi:hypothetical protein
LFAIRTDEPLFETNDLNLHVHMSLRIENSLENNFDGKR